MYELFATVMQFWAQKCNFRSHELGIPAKEVSEISSEYYMQTYDGSAEALTNPRTSWSALCSHHNHRKNLMYNSSMVHLYIRITMILRRHGMGCRSH